MAYIDQHQDPARQAVAIAGVVAVHLAIGAGLLLGLTVAGYGPIPDIYDPPTFPLPPEPTPTPEPDQQEITDNPIVTPPLPPIDLYPDPVDPVVTDTVINPLPDFDSDRMVPIPTPTPTFAPKFTPKPARPANRTASWVSTDDYPRQPLVDEIEGVTGYSLVIGTTGKVTACEVTQSSGNRALDEAACKWISRRARFEPATDGSGAKVLGRYTGTVRWEIPD